jgi:hypothetical protein
VSTAEKCAALSLKAIQDRVFSNGRKLANHIRNRLAWVGERMSPRERTGRKQEEEEKGKTSAK